MNWNQPEHCYEELRDVVLNVMLDASGNGVDRFDKLLEQTALALYKRDESAQGRQYFSHGSATQLHPNDSELVLEIVWDLFRQGILTLGLNASNPGWPWLRLTRFGECALQQGPYRFHNNAEFMKALRSEVIDISPDAVVYLREAVAAFYMDCLLSTCVLLSIAAESEFLRMLRIAKSSGVYGSYFTRIGDGLNIRAKMSRFHEAIKPIVNLLPTSATDELENNLSIMQSLLRIAKTESGQPSAARPPSRDQVYVYLQLFIPFAEQLMQLRRLLSEPARPRLVRMP